MIALIIIKKKMGQNFFRMEELSAHEHFQKRGISQNPMHGKKKFSDIFVRWKINNVSTHFFDLLLTIIYKNKNRVEKTNEE